MIAQGSQSRISFIDEVTPGTTPATPAMQEISIVSFSLGTERDTIEDDSIQSNRQPLEARTGNNNITGQIVFKLRHGAYNSFFESFFASAFNLGVLKVGSTKKTLTIEQAHTDIGQYLIYRGVVATSMSIAIDDSSTINVTMDLLALSETLQGTSIADSIIPVQDKPALIHSDGTIGEGGSTTNIVTNLSIDANNNYVNNYALGDRDPIETTQGSFTLSGTLSAYFVDEVLYNKFLNETASSLTVNYTDLDGNTLDITVPAFKYGGAGLPVQPESMVLEMPFTAHYDSVSGTTLMIEES